MERVEPKVSIVTSLYRGEAFLEQFLQHLNKIENAGECEWILVHNDPTEKEIAILKQHWPSRMGLVQHMTGPREGLYTSWNRAIERAAGKYIAIWNVDDIRTPGSIRAQKEALDNSEAVMCYGDFYGTAVYGEYTDKLYEYPEYRFGIQEAFKRHIIGCFPMWRKDLHQQVGYLDEQFKLVSDYEWQLRVIRRFPLVKADGVLGFYLEDAGHKLSSNRKVQTAERTAVELRYKMYDKILIHFLPLALKYRIHHVLNFGVWTSVSSLVPLQRRGSLLKMPFMYGGWFIKKGFEVLSKRVL
jgi:GT2 family glycosyltransferase